MAIESGDDSVATELGWIEAARGAGLGRQAAHRLLALAARDPVHAIGHRRAAGLLQLQAGEIENGLALLAETDGVHVPRGTTETLAALAVARLRLGRLPFDLIVCDLMMP